MLPAPEIPVVAVVGPTATGKSALALALAEELGGEIVNADSRQVYRGMDIGTARPSSADEARVPHHGYGLADPRDPYSLALFIADATATVRDVHARGRIPILVGGTGQYTWGLLEGWSVPAVPPDESLRRELASAAAADGAEALHQRLSSVDPAAAASIDPRNVRRVIRALEVISATGRPFSELRTKRPPPWSVSILGVDLPDAVLAERIEQRVDAMIAAGFVDEVRCLLDEGVPRAASAMLSIGYRELAAMLYGECTLSEAREETIRATRRFVRRQRQWFRRTDERIHWVTGLDDACAHLPARSGAR